MSDISASWTVPAPERVTVRHGYGSTTNPGTYSFIVYPLHGGWELRMNNGLRDKWYSSRPSEDQLAEDSREMIREDIEHMKWSRAAAERDAQNSSERFDTARIVEAMDAPPPTWFDRILRRRATSG